MNGEFSQGAARGSYRRIGLDDGPTKVKGDMFTRTDLQVRANEPVFDVSLQVIPPANAAHVRVFRQ